MSEAKERRARRTHLLEPRPPEGSIWSAIDEARVELGLSPTGFAEASLGKSSRSLYGRTFEAMAWESVKPPTLAKYVAYLVARGISPERFQSGIAAFHQVRQAVPVGVERDRAERAKAIARDIELDGKYTYAEALAAALDIEQINGDDLSWRRATLLSLATARRPEKAIGRSPTPKHPNKPPKVGR